MSDPEQDIAGRKSPASSEGSSTDLDVTSPTFKPLRALYSNKTQIPVPHAKPLDNVTSFEARFRMLGGFDERYSDQRIQEIRRAASSAKTATIPQGEAPVRRFLPHQEMVQGYRRTRFQRNIYTKIENFEGPLGEMRTWMRERVRVKVYTRKEKGVRGFVTGFIEVFDKHWNLALSDVFESWRRRKYRYSENKRAGLGKPQDCSELLRKMGISVPETAVKSVDRKYVMCSRRVPKLIVRGEQVVLVTPESVVQVKAEKGAATVVVKKEKEITVKIEKSED
ncbi:LSM11 protein [Culex quinquefasciatus]|uniref:LSM11 protein n=1 Tax=Culex quinquefasciatus TaxID=7176 RepID=B0W6X4_CULQU|nr:U7 snRNA-associated Sm-like protein LSm11 [Culex quinquefasciatus]EDS37120.1 LSM11 protein [Culex quinquefasciatus]|eukprot:XP_001844458.1 LSM11 protein [Culex quinquefasciatus]